MLRARSDSDTVDDDSAPDAKKHRIDDNITPVNESVIRFLTRLLHFVRRYKNLGVAMPDNATESWIATQSDIFIKCFQDKNNDNDRFVSLFPAFLAVGLTVELALATIKIHNLAANATKIDDAHAYGFEYILSADSADVLDKWQVMSLRVVYACALWRKKCVVQEQLNLILLDHLTNSDSGKALVQNFREEYFLNPKLLPKVLICADDFATVHTYHGRTFYNMRFAAHADTATHLIQRAPNPPRDLHVSLSSEEDKKEAKSTDRLEACFSVELQNVLASNQPPDVIAVSGESGGGKTFTALLTAVEMGVAFYVSCTAMHFYDLEKYLAQVPDEALHPKMVYDYLLDRFKSYGWNVEEKTARNVCLVLDEIGPYPKCARAVCKLQSKKEEKAPKSSSKNEEPQAANDDETSRADGAECPATPELNESTTAAKSMKTEPTFNELLQGFKNHFKTDGRVVVFVVGTGIEGAFTHVVNDSMPNSCRHLRVEEFADLRKLYVAKSRFWANVVANVPTAELSCGIFARLRRLAENPRMAALLASLDTISARELENNLGQHLTKARSLGAKSSYLRGRAINMVSNAIIHIKSFNSLNSVDQMTATTWFGAAFALACSSEAQDDKMEGMHDEEEHPCITALRTTYGLMSDLLVKGIKQSLNHRFVMTSAAVELGFSGFGMAPPQNEWSGFEHMMADLFFLHAFGAACAGECGIKLPATVGSKNPPEHKFGADPLVLVKDYLRTHGYNARKVIRVQLNQQVKTYCAAAEALEKEAKLVCGPTAEKEPCVVVALNGDKAPFADILVGLLSAEDGSFKTTHLMLVQLKLYTSTKLTVLQEWEEMRKMGSREREAVIAGCVTQLNQSFEDAMKPLSLAENHRGIFENAKVKFLNPTKKNTPQKVEQFVPTAATKNALFAALCNDVRVQVRPLTTPYEIALECYTRVGQLNLAATLANFLDVRQAREKPLPKNELILQPASKLPDGSKKFLPQSKKFLKTESTKLLTKLNQILTALTEKAVKFNDIIQAYIDAAKKYSIDIDPGWSPEVERFVVTYYAPKELEQEEPDQEEPDQEEPDQGEPDQGEPDQEEPEEEEPFPATGVPPPACAVTRPKYSITITAANCRAAFYPTSWETDGFTTSTMTCEVVRLSPSVRHDNEAKQSDRMSSRCVSMRKTARHT